MKRKRKQTIKFDSLIELFTVDDMFTQHGEQSLQIAIVNGCSLNAVRYLIEDRHCPISHVEILTDAPSWHATCAAIQYGRMDIVEYLHPYMLNYPLDITTFGDPLQIAIQHQQYQFIEWLIKSKDFPYQWENVIKFATCPQTTIENRQFIELFDRYLLPWLQATNFKQALDHGMQLAKITDHDETTFRTKPLKQQFIGILKEAQILSKNDNTLNMLVTEALSNLSGERQKLTYGKFFQPMQQPASSAPSALYIQRHEFNLT